jgi:hypothetical protein
MQGIRTWKVATGVLVAASLLLGIAAVGSARLIDEVSITMSKHEDGPYVDMAPVVKVNSPRSLYLRARNNVSGPVAETLVDASHADNLNHWRIRWYRGNHDITSQMSGSGYDFVLRAGKSKVFRAYVKPKTKHPGALCVEGNFDETAPHPGERNGAFYVNSETICG